MLQTVVFRLSSYHERNLSRYWVAPEGFGSSQGEIIANLMNYNLSHLEDVYKALQNGQLKLVPTRRR
jgi:hypothetical protein